jgi:hypothetical protein
VRQQPGIFSFHYSDCIRKIKKPTQCAGFPCAEIVGQSDWPNVFGPRPFRAVSWIVRDALPLTETIEIRALDIRHVKEHVLVRSGLDKSETLVRQPFDASLSHAITFHKNNSAMLPDIIWSGRSTARNAVSIHMPLRRSQGRSLSVAGRHFRIGHKIERLHGPNLPFYCPWP